MEKIIDAAGKDELEKALKPFFVRNTNKAGNEIYILNHHNAPLVMQEIGRLREITFRAGGGGTGKASDIDVYDTREEGYYEQLIVWSPEDREIVGGYRFIDCSKVINESQTKVSLSTADYFDVSAVCIRNFLNRTIELGRSWVQPNFQPALNRKKGIFALDNIWDGLGAITVDNPNIEFFFGKVTMYKSFNPSARDMILYFLKTYFPDYQNLISPRYPVEILMDIQKLEALFDKSLQFNEAYKVLNHEVRDLGENIPPLVNSYMNLSPTMKTFGTSNNPHFRNVEETAILIAIKDIYEQKKKRHIESYTQELQER